MKVTLVDSPVANIANIARALRVAGADLRVSSDPKEIAAAGKIVLPGVGSFRAAMTWLQEHRVDDALRAAISAGSALLGVCVGHQLLFDDSEEMGTTAGLSLIAGSVRRLTSTLPVPQIGWNAVQHDGSLLFTAVAENAPFYFVNSYAAANVTSEVARASYGAMFTAAVQSNRVFGVQFHPEKSSTAGLQVLRNFVRLA